MSSIDETPETETPSLRDALENAFDEVADTPSEPEASDAPGSEDDGQPRDEQGRWTKAQREHFEAQQRAQEADAAEAPEPTEQELRLAPPIGWSPAAKAAYGQLPLEVQEAVARREQEINNGFAKLRDYKGLDSFAEMARASGTSLKEAFERYKAAEDALDQNFEGGVMQLCEMYGVHPMALAQTIASQYGGQPQDSNQPAAMMDPNAALLARELAGIKDTVRTLMTERERAEEESINAHLSDFAQANMYYEDVRKQMGLLIKTGQANSLEEAYDKACWMHPDIRDLLIKERAAPQTAQARVSQARRASGSLPTGAPAGNSSPGNSSSSLRSALEDAWGQANV